MEVSQGQVRSWQLIWRGERNPCSTLEAGFPNARMLPPPLGAGFCTVIDDSELTVEKKEVISTPLSIRMEGFLLDSGSVPDGKSPDGMSR